jgi:hypothetical protein
LLTTGDFCRVRLDLVVSDSQLKASLEDKVGASGG